MTLPSNLPSIAHAQLPALYENAKTTLSTCSSIDECKSWADKAAALASYAKQADDEELQAFAARIRARAIRRCGELLAEIRPKPGTRTDVEPRGSSPPRLEVEPTRSQAAADAGMSADQRKAALRVAAVPEPEFTAALEAPKPATVTELAERGTKSQPKPLFDLHGRAPEDFQRSTQGQAELRNMAELAARIGPDVVLRGALDGEVAGIERAAHTVLAWVSDLITHIEEDKP